MSREDVLVRTLLESWGLDSLKEIFDDSGIDGELFVSLSQPQIDQLLPMSVPLGIKWKFMKRHEDYVKSLASNEENKAPWNQMEQSECSSTDGHNGSDPLRIESDDSFDKPLSELVSDNKRPLLSEKSKDSKKMKMVDPNLIAKEKLAAFTSHDEIQNLDLKTFLTMSLDGKSILNSYAVNGYLESDDQSLLVDLLMKWVLFRKQKPKKEDYICLKDKILMLFPNEENLYYIPPRSEGKKQIMPRGKLYDRTRNIQEWMRKKGLLPRVHGMTKPKDNSDRLCSGPIIELTNEIKLALDWLQNYREPWTDVVQKWSMTSAYRLGQLTRMSTGDCDHVCGSSLDEYCNKYKVLSQPQGYTLLEIDFQTLHRGKEGNLLQNWADFRRKIIEMATSNAVRDPEGKELLRALGDCSTEDEKNLIVLQLLPSLLPPSRLVSCGSKKIKPSIKESREFFISRVKIPAEVQPFIMQRKQDIVKSYGSMAPLQPYILYVGEEVNKCEAIYVIVRDTLYKFDSVMKSLDICFMSFFALDLCYPVHSDHVWLLIQKVLYNVTSGDEPNILKVAQLINKLESANTDDML